MITLLEVFGARLLPPPALARNSVVLLVPVEPARYPPSVIKTGDVAPDFTAPTTDGRTLRLTSLRGQPVVVYFFPKAFTGG
jgi:cytochrome oxidase Cu insertion factor (SCO1/SenC/PrrC family)